MSRFARELGLPVPFEFEFIFDLKLDMRPDTAPAPGCEADPVAPLDFALGASACARELRATCSFPVPRLIFS